MRGRNWDALVAHRDSTSHFISRDKRLSAFVDVPFFFSSAARVPPAGTILIVPPPFCCHMAWSFLFRRVSSRFVFVFGFRSRF